MPEPSVAPQSPSVLRLDYAPPRSFLRRRWRRVAILTLLVTGVAVAFARRAELRWAYDRYQYLRLQSRCLSFAPPPSRVVYDETPEAAARLADPEYVTAYRTSSSDPVTAVWRPRAFADYWPTVGHPSGPPDGAAVIFLHERTTPSGARRLVCVTVSLHILLGSHQQMLWFEAYAAEPATWATAPAPRGVATVRLIGPDPNDRAFFREERLRVFAGQADPADASRFSFDYELEGQRGTVDGWLRDPEREGAAGVEMVKRPGSP